MKTFAKRAVLVAMLSLGAGGCIAAAAAGGAAVAGAIYYTSRGVKTVLNRNVAQTTSATSVAFRRLGIAKVGQQDKEKGERVIYGKAGKHDVTVDITPETARAVDVEVIVQESAVSWNTDMARTILNEISRAAGSH